MAKKLLIADLLCGAGGSSTGAIRALLELGWTMEEIILVCVNHWQTAIDTHQRNHREARHYVQDIATVRPHLIVPEGFLDLLMASPTCTYHSIARGGKPTSDQQRSDPWHIITWLTELRVKRIIIENVWEFIGWGPVDPRTGRPIKSRKGEYFHAWIETIKRLGFEPEWRKLNAANYGDATTRHRFILFARSDGRRLLWPVATHAKRDDVQKLDRNEGLIQGTLDLEPTRQTWRGAREIIDWSIKGKSIFGRKKPLAPKTLFRILAGALKFGWPQPYIVMLIREIENSLRFHINWFFSVRNKPASTAERAKRRRVVREYVARLRHFLVSPRAASEPLPTIVTGGQRGSGTALISPYYGSGSGETCVSANDPLPTVTVKGRFGMVVPVTQSGGGAQARDIDQPIPTLTTAKGGEFAIVLPVTHDGSADRVRSPLDPLPTITGANRGELAFITAQHGERPGQVPRVHDIAAPTPTIAASGHIDLVEPSISTEGYDILFRMLEPHELAAAMGFNTDDQEYEFAGTKTEKIKQIGNAVSVAKMKACVASIMADAAPRKTIKTTEEFREAAE